MLIQLTVENFLRITAAQLDLHPGMNVIGGKNRAGKTSVLAAADALFGGRAAEPDDPIHHGADEARIEGIVSVDGEPKYRIEKVFRAGSDHATFRVSSADGKQRYSRPQELLESIYGSGRFFDPRAFVQMKPPDRAEIVREMAGLDFADLDRRRQGLYDERRDVNRDLKAAAAILEALPAAPPGTPDIEVDAAALLRELAAAHSSNAIGDRLGQQVARCRQDLEIARQQLADATKRHEAAEAAVGRTLRVDPSPMEEALAAAQSTNGAVRALLARRKAAGRLKELGYASAQLSAQIDTLDGDRRLMTEAAIYPLPGMGFDQEGRFTFGGLPFEQASEAEQIRLATAIGLRMRPVVLIRDGSAFDSENLAELDRYVTEAGGQAIVQVVKDSDDGVGFYLEDGALLQRDPAAQP